nr:MAG TPA: hypothetical protein [Bacteriophage sp.]
MKIPIIIFMKIVYLLKQKIRNIYQQLGVNK